MKFLTATSPAPNAYVAHPDLAAILAADATGFSRLMQNDEHATMAALDAARSVFRTQIEAHQGRVMDMAGDSVFAVFETASGAVAAAQEVQKALNVSVRWVVRVYLGPPSG